MVERADQEAGGRKMAGGRHRLRYSRKNLQGSCGLFNKLSEHIQQRGQDAEMARNNVSRQVDAGYLQPRMAWATRFTAVMLIRESQCMETQRIRVHMSRVAARLGRAYEHLKGISVGESPTLSRASYMPRIIHPHDQRKMVWPSVWVSGVRG